MKEDQVAAVSNFIIMADLKLENTSLDGFKTKLQAAFPELSIGDMWSCLYDVWENRFKTYNISRIDWVNIMTHE